MQNELLVICPTRGRVKQCKRMIESFDDTSVNSDLIFIIDYDDKHLKEYMDLLNCTKHSYAIREESSLCETYNSLVLEHFPDYKFYSITCDDFIYNTDCWDEILISRLVAKGGGFAYGDDGYGGSALPTTCVISGEIVQALGWVVLPTLKHLCGDMVWRELGQKLNRLFYVPEVSIEHMTPLAHKSEIDDTHRRTNASEIYTLDNKSFRYWISHHLENDLRKINKLYL